MRRGPIPELCLSRCPYPYGPGQLGQPEGAGSANPLGAEWESGYRPIHPCPPPLVGSMDRHVPRPLGFIAPCLPSPSQKAPSGSAWVHEIKHDGYRLMARRDGNRVRLFTRRGYDWSGKYPWIVEALRSLRVRSIIVDGEAVWAGKDGKSDFDKLHWAPSVGSNGRIRADK
jgi:ATP dependent DNA ligase domain